MSEKFCRKCPRQLKTGRALDICPHCHRKAVKAWRDGMTMQPTPEFPGVDIDAIHRNPRFKRGGG